RVFAHADVHAGPLFLAVDQPGVAAELLAALEATDGVDLQQDGHRDDPADPGDALEHREFGGVVLLGRDLDVTLESADLGVQRPEQVESGLDPAAGVRPRGVARPPAPPPPLPSLPPPPC